MTGRLATHAIPRLLVLAATICAACTGTVVEEAGPSTTPSDTAQTSPPGTVQRSKITATIGIAPEDQALAARAGLLLQGTTVTAQSLYTTEAAHTAVVGASGVVVFDSLLQGVYEIGFDRKLTAAELARLSAAEQEISVVAGSARVILRPPAPATVTITGVAPRRGSLVISELYAHRSGSPFFYAFGTYLEVYNNSDSTIYLDGMLLFRTSAAMETDIWGSCGVGVPFRNDSTTIWAYLVHAFPGTGRDFPIAPGAAKVVAMDAMNHTAASQPNTDQWDLSNADFEQIGSDADINNPFVPDMVRIVAGTGALGRGYPLDPDNSYGVATATPISQFKLATIYQQNGTGSLALYGIPASAVLDIASVMYTPAERAALDALNAVVRDCQPWLAPNFELSAAPIFSFANPMAMARKSLGHLPSGRELLQRTRNSARDFDYATPLRRSLYKP